MIAVSVKPLFFAIFTVSLLLAVMLLSPSTPGKLDIWSVGRVVEWRPCTWWLQGHLTALPIESNGYIRVDCYGGLNQMRRDLSFCDGVGIARLLNATLVLPKFEAAAYWNESSGFADVFDVDYFIQQVNGFVKVVKELPPEIVSKEPFQVDCRKRKGQLDYIESILPSLLEHHYISITPAMSQRRDRYPKYAKAALCQACYGALRLTRSLEKKASELLEAIPKPFLSLHLRFEPDMVAYSQCEYSGLSPASMEAIEAARGDRKQWTGELARIWRKRGKCPLTPNETALILEMVAAMRAYKGLHKTLFLSRRAFAELTFQGLKGKELMQALRTTREEALPDCFCEFKL
uniref:O-fucosyltransferase family protein n=1 Tax=Manihot esculenta TaxID=3983 RepID=A0A2C9W1N1_MANES